MHLLMRFTETVDSCRRISYQHFILIFIAPAIMNVYDRLVYSGLASIFIFKTKTVRFLKKFFINPNEIRSCQMVQSQMFNNFALKSQLNSVISLAGRNHSTGSFI